MKSNDFYTQSMPESYYARTEYLIGTETRLKNTMNSFAVRFGVDSELTAKAQKKWISANARLSGHLADFKS